MGGIDENPISIAAGFGCVQMTCPFCDEAKRWDAYLRGRIANLELQLLGYQNENAFVHEENRRLYDEKRNGANKTDVSEGAD